MNGMKPWFGIVFAFVVGVIVGGLVMAVLVKTHMIQFMRGGPPRMHEVIGRELTGNLDLTAPQREEISRILAEYETTFRELGRTSREQLQATASSMETRIRGILSPAQQQRYDESVRRMHERMERHRERGGHKGRGDHGEPGDRMAPPGSRGNAAPPAQHPHSAREPVAAQAA